MLVGAPSATRTTARLRAPLLVLLAVILLGAGVTEASLKAAFVYNFTKLVTWSEASLGSPTDPFVVGVVGKSGLGAELEAALLDKNVGGRPIEVRRWPTVDDIGRCHILWVSPEIVSDDDAMRHVVARRNVLVIGDAENLASRGGMVRLYREETADGVKIRFEFNVEAARGAGLDVSSKLLSLARIVTGTVPEQH
jgi:YfiR/HmsC-like